MDGTVATVEAIDDPRVRLIRQPENRGVSAARNAGIAEARGEFIAFLDSDDAMYPERVERQVGLFREDPALTICGTGVMLIDENGRELRVPWVPVTGDFDMKWHGLWGPSTNMSTVMVRREAIVARGVLFDEALDLGEDYDFISRVLFSGGGENICDPLTYVREHQSSSISDRSPERVDRMHRTIMKVSVMNLAACGINITELTTYLIRGFRQGDFSGVLGHLTGKEIQRIKDAYESIQPAFAKNYTVKRGVFL